MNDLPDVADLAAERADLDAMSGNQTPCGVAAAVLQGLEDVIREEPPDWLLVQGDTTTAMAASIAAFYGRVRVGHVEAGLRTWDRNHPFPEEINRRLISVVADLHFAPTELSRENLLRESIPEEQIVVTGNPVIDALLLVADMPDAPAGSLLRDIPDDKRLIVVTAHRRENHGEGIQSICSSLASIAEQRDDVHIVYPVHLNPNVREPVYELLDGVPGITLLPPLDYVSLVHLMKRASLILTDSGGIQEEAPSLGKPVLVLREKTERPEGVEAGTVRIVGTHAETILSETYRLLDDEQEYRRMATEANPYGDGHAAERIVAAMLDRPLDQAG